MRYFYECVLSENNNKSTLHQFYIHLSGGAGVGKRFLVKVITRYLKRVLKFPDHTKYQPSFLVAASTRKAAANMNSTTLHPASCLPVKTVRVPSKYLKPTDRVLHSVRNKYRIFSKSPNYR